MSPRPRRNAPLAATIVAAACVFAATPAPADVALTVQPLVLQFKAQPGETGHATVTVENNGSETERVTVQQVDWHTNSVGTVQLERIGAEGDRSLNGQLRASTTGFVLAPGETRKVTLDLHVPDDFARNARSYWGGYLIRGSAAQGAAQSIGPGATVLAYNTIGAPPRHLSVHALRVSPGDNHAPKIFTRIANDGQDYLRPVTRMIVSADGRVVRDESLSTAVIFPGDSRVIEKTLDDLPHGDYRLQLTFDYGGGSLLEGSTRFAVH
jgi:hypothetical protein